MKEFNTNKKRQEPSLLAKIITFIILIGLIIFVVKYIFTPNEPIKEDVKQEIKQEEPKTFEEQVSEKNSDFDEVKTKINDTYLIVEAYVPSVFSVGSGARNIKSTIYDQIKFLSTQKDKTKDLKTYQFNFFIDTNDEYGQKTERVKYAVIEIQFSEINKINYDNVYSFDLEKFWEIIQCNDYQLREKLNE